MVFPNIEKIKQDYTDKYVVVDARRPELARFADYTGIVKTVNMSGRALVEFMDYHLNIGWYDIDLNYLKVVDQPVVREKKVASKPAAKKADTGGEKKPAKAAGGAKPSTSDILAKLRGGGGAVPAKPAASPATKAAPPASEPASSDGGKVDRSKMSVAEMLAMARGGGAPAAKSESAPAAEKPVPKPAAKSAASAPAGKVDRSKMSVAEMIALARNKDAGGDAAAESEPEPVASEEPVAVEAPAAQPSTGEIVKLDRSSMSVADMLAYCREHDV